MIEKRYNIQFTKKKDKEEFLKLIEVHSNLNMVEAVMSAIRFYNLHSPYVKLLNNIAKKDSVLEYRE